MHGSDLREDAPRLDPPARRGTTTPATAALARLFMGTSLTAWSLIALGAGLALGVIAHRSGSHALGVLATSVKPIGDLWVAALRLMVLPLVISLTLASIVGARGAASLGALGGRAVLLFVALLAAGGLLTVALAPAIIARYAPAPGMAAALQSGVPVPEAARAAAAAGPGAATVGQWIAGLLPSNLVDAALRGDILALLLFSILFGVAVRRLPDEQRTPLARAFRGLADAMLQCVRWVLWVSPFGVFALSYVLTARTGGDAVRMLSAYLVIISGMLLLETALLYPTSAVLGRTTIAAFARAVAPAQLVAVTTRSSIAALPALIEGGQDSLRLPASSTSLVLPLTVSLFKIDLPVSDTVKLFFLAHVYGIPLAPGTVATFVVTIILFSFSTPGVPSSGPGLKALPLYVAAGIPIEGVLLLEAVNTIPDIFETLVNVTGDMSVATILSRRSNR